MKTESVKSTRICLENDEQFYDKWFSQKTEKSFINHVDTLYFMVTPNVEDYHKSTGWQEFVHRLENEKKVAEMKREAVPVFTDVLDGLEVRPYVAAQMYSYHFGLKENFDFFICSSVPNENTPPIMVQIRSNALWIDGMVKTFDRAYDCIKQVLELYGIQIIKTQENRIDYAFHTNYFNDLLSVFPENDLGKMFVGNFKRGRKDFDFHNDEENKYGDSECESDYFTLGRHKSNNVFLRVYNKVKEVVEMGYKQFFIPIWLKYGLINQFDVYVLEKAFKYGRYEQKDKARCEFYYDYGTDDDIKREIYDKLQNPDTPTKWFTKMAKRLVPDITIITNVEIQTKRKFYDRKELDIVTTEQSPKKNLYNIFEQMSEIVRFLTNDTLRFVKYKGKYAEIHRTKRPMADWWKRLRSSGRVEIVKKWEIDYIHLYQHSLDFERQKLLTLKKNAKAGAFTNYSEGVFEVGTERKPQYHLVNDFQKFYEYLNDNDLRKYVATKEGGFRDIKKKLRQNELTAEKRITRPPPKLRESSGQSPLELFPQMLFTCQVCGRTKPAAEFETYVPDTRIGECKECYNCHDEEQNSTQS